MLYVSLVQQSQKELPILGRNIKTIATKFAVIVAGVVGLALYSTDATAMTTTMPISIAFDSAITLTKITDVNFGIVTALQANTYKITTLGVVTKTGGAGTGVWLGGTHTPGNYLIKGSATATINITAQNYVANNAVTPSLATCAYNGGAEVACTTLTAQLAPTAVGKTLLFGISVTASGAQAAGTTALPTFDIVVTYT